MAGNFEGIRTRNFGIEIEMTGLTRCQAARAIAKVLGGTAFHEGGSYDKYTVDDEQGRTWSIVYDGSVKCVDANGNSASKSYSVELNSPVLGYEDIPLLQEVIRALRHAKGRCGPEYCCGTHLHISADDYTPQQIRNLVNIFASKEDFLWDALQVSSAREGYCSKSDKHFVEQLNQKKPKTIEKIKELWYRGNMSEQYRHYSNTRYHALNLHSYFQHGHYEIRCCNASLHAGEVRAQIVLALAISNAAMTKKYCSPSVSHSDNMRYSFRVWLLNLGLIGDEYKNCRTHLLKHLSGNIAWRHPEDAIAQRERLRQERIAAREQEHQNEPHCDERVGRLSIQGRHTFGFEQHPVSASGHPVSEVREEVGETPDENLEAAVSDCDDFKETEDEGMAMSM